MVNQYPLWKYALITIVLAAGLFFSTPNLFGEDPSVQVSGTRGGVVDEGLLTNLTQRLEQFGITPGAAELSEGRALIRFASIEDQLKAQDVINEELGRQYVVALNLAPATPGWFSDLGALPMYLGLDLRGGVHFLMEVDMDGAVNQAEQRFVGDLRSAFREEKIRSRGLTRRAQGGIRVVFQDAGVRDAADDLVSRRFPELLRESVEVEGSPGLLMTLSEPAAREIREFALDQNITTLRNRVNELGVAEPVIQQQGENRIVIQLPGVQDSARAKDLLGATAQLEFRMVAGDGSTGTGREYRDRQGRPITLRRSIVISGDHIVDAASGIEQQSGSPAVFITLDGKGAVLMSERTRDEIGRPMATVYMETKVFTEKQGDELVKRKERIEEVINVATIRDQLGKRFQITGLDSTNEARDLALLLRAGALAAPIEIVEERTVGPSLGQDNIDQGKMSVIIGFVLVLVFMAIYYKVFGLVANLALTFNRVMIVAVLSLLQATLTLPGIAGIVLTVGMAVDANVLIFERIREELRNGNSPQASIHAGYAKAFSTIADANITTLIAAVLLFGFGTGPIKGFAVTLSVGILTSMFTAIMGTRAVVNLIYGGRRVERLSI
jgi:preprotein translocase subunit SecD